VCRGWARDFMPRAFYATMGERVSPVLSALTGCDDLLIVASRLIIGEHP